MSHKLLVYKKGYSFVQIKKYLSCVDKNIKIDIKEMPLQDNLRDRELTELIWVFGPLTHKEKEMLSVFSVSRTLLHRENGNCYKFHNQKSEEIFFVNLDRDSIDIINDLHIFPQNNSFITLNQLEEKSALNLLVYHGHGTYKGWMGKMQFLPQSRIVLSFSCRSTLNKKKELSFAHQAVLEGRVRTFFGTNCLINHDHNKELMHIVIKLIFEFPYTPIGLLLGTIKKRYAKEKRVLQTLEKFELIGDPTSSCHRRS